MLPFKKSQTRQTSLPARAFLFADYFALEPETGAKVPGPPHTPERPTRSWLQANGKPPERYRHWSLRRMRAFSGRLLSPKGAPGDVPGNANGNRRASARMPPSPRTTETSGKISIERPQSREGRAVSAPISLKSGRPRSINPSGPDNSSLDQPPHPDSDAVPGLVRGGFHPIRHPVGGVPVRKITRRVNKAPRGSMENLLR